MGYTVTLYTNSSNTNTVDKALTQIGETSFDIQSIHSNNILSPDIIIDYDASFLDCNYCYVSTFKRYYFVIPETDTAQRIILHCSSDPLTTAYYLYNLIDKECSVVRSESEGATDIIDKSYPVNPSKIWYEGLILPANDLSINNYPYIISVNATYS